MNIREHSKRWLVVDDDPAVLEFTARVLRKRSDSEVVACDNPRHALEEFLADPESFEMLVTDFDMPGFDGLELARRIRSQSPRLPVLMISGGALNADDAFSAGLDAFLAKPYLPDTLLDAVRTLIPPHSDQAGTMEVDDRPTASESPGTLAPGDSEKGHGGGRRTSDDNRSQQPTGSTDADRERHFDHP